MHTPTFNEPQCEYEAECLDSPGRFAGPLLCLTVLFVGLTCAAILLTPRRLASAGLLALLCLTGCASYKPQANPKPVTLGMADKTSADPVTTR